MRHLLDKFVAFLLLLTLAAPASAQQLNPYNIVVGTTAGTVASGADNRIVGALQSSNNLSDVSNAATSRVNLGLGATSSVGFGSVTAGLVNLPDSTYSQTNIISGGVDPSYGAYIGGSGAGIVYCSIGGCLPQAPTTGLVQGIVINTTQFDGASSEVTLATETTSKTGYSKVWHTSTGYASGANVSNSNQLYRAIQSGNCVSASSGSGPSVTSGTVTDGTCTWLWINSSAGGSKVSLENVVHMESGAGATWVQANNLEVDSGAQYQFFTNTELDLTNNTGDCSSGVGNCYDLYMGMNGNYASTAWIGMSGGGANPNPSIYQAHYGILMSGAQIAEDYAFLEGTAATVGIGFNRSHGRAAIEDTSSSLISLNLIGIDTTAVIVDGSTSPKFISIPGTVSHSAGDIVDASTSSVAIQTSGTRTGTSAVFNDSSTSNTGISLSGTYSSAAISTGSATTSLAFAMAAGQSICFSGAIQCASYSSGTGLLNITPELSLSNGLTSSSTISLASNQKLCVDGSNSCAYYSTSAHKWYFTDENNVTLFSVAETTGNAIFKGTVTQSGTP